MFKTEIGLYELHSVLSFPGYGNTDIMACFHDGGVSPSCSAVICLFGCMPIEGKSRESKKSISVEGSANLG